LKGSFVMFSDSFACSKVIINVSVVKCKIHFKIFITITVFTKMN
jgi:hypothetical protein